MCPEQRAGRGVKDLHVRFEDSGVEATVKCAYRRCRKRLRLNPEFGGEGKQWCSKEHRAWTLEGRPHWKVRPMFAWYDLWVGVFVDRAKRRVYIFPLPCLGLVVSW